MNISSITIILLVTKLIAVKAVTDYTFMEFDRKTVLEAVMLKYLL